MYYLLHCRCVIVLDVPVSREIWKNALIVEKSRYGVGGNGADRRGRDDIATLKQVGVITHLRESQSKARVNDHYNNTGW